MSSNNPAVRTEFFIRTDTRVQSMHGFVNDDPCISANIPERHVIGIFFQKVRVPCGGNGDKPTVGKGCTQGVTVQVFLELVVVVVPQRFLEVVNAHVEASGDPSDFLIGVGEVIEDFNRPAHFRHFRVKRFADFIQHAMVACPATVDIFRIFGCRCTGCAAVSHFYTPYISLFFIGFILQSFTQECHFFMKKPSEGRVFVIFN